MSYPKTPREASFFVGYLPTPRALRRFLIGASAMIALLALAAAFTLSSRQVAPEGGAFQFGVESVFEGVVSSEPAPLLWTTGTDGAKRPILLVSQWKFGADERADAVDQKVCVARGSLIKDDKIQLLELAAGSSALSPSTGAPRPPATPEWTFTGHTVVRGEIIDPKCFFGVMKPGHGKTHKACASRCISGGIPPFLWVREQAGDGRFYLLLDEIGDAAHEIVLPFVAEPVEIRGHVMRASGAPFQAIRMDVGGVRRIR